MRLTLLLSFLFITVFVNAQKKDVEVFHQAQDDGTLFIMAKNNTDVLQSVVVNIILKGMESSEPLPVTKLLDPKKETRITILKPVKKSYSYNTQLSYIKGDITANHNDKTVYQLPYKSGESYKIDQGYNGISTHMGKFALDFHMDEGTEVCAIRDGVVFEVQESNNRGCPSNDCSKFNNFILVRHDDGSIADYSHIKKNGALVKTGDQVKAGDVIALSGSTGYASGPHLHLEVYVMRLNGQNSVNAQYQLGNSVGIPKEGESYRKN